MRYEDFQTSKKLSEEEIEEKAIEMGARDIWLDFSIDKGEYTVYYYKAEFES